MPSVSSFRPVRSTRSVVALLALAVPLAVAAPAAQAAATIVSPATNTKVANDRTPFTWAMAPGETAARLTLQTKYYPKNKLQLVTVETPGIPDGTTSWTSAMPLFSGGYRWSVTTNDAAGTAVTSTPSDFFVAEHFKVGAAKLRLVKAGKQVSMVAPVTTNSQTVHATLRVKVNGRTWYSNSGTYSQKRKEIDIAAPIAYDPLHRPSAKLAKGSKVVATLTVSGDFATAVTRTARLTV